MSEHTPTPWEAHIIPGFKHSTVTTSHPRDPSIDIKTVNHAADAAFIVRAVNAHAALKAALLTLANAADAVGVKFFDTDTMEPEVEAMQAATLAARRALEEA